MTNYDVFNGDADGICALQQLRLANPIDSKLITGVKRDINLLKKISASKDDQVTVLDISLDKNRESLLHVLSAGAKVQYFDHHFAGDIPEDRNLQVFIDTAADTCTSLIVNAHLNNANSAWAVVGAYGDNFDKSAEAVAQKLTYSSEDLLKLKKLGICINYNGYGATIEDLYFPPDELFKALNPYSDPLDFINGSETFEKTQYRLSTGHG